MTATTIECRCPKCLVEIDTDTDAMFMDDGDILGIFCEVCDHEFSIQCKISIEYSVDDKPFTTKEERKKRIFR